MKTDITIFLRIIARGDYFFFRAKRGDYLREGDYSREPIISNNAYWKSCPKEWYVFLLLLFSKKIITSNKRNMGFSSVPNLVRWLVFRAWIVTDLAGSGAASAWQGGDKRKRRHGKRGKKGRLFEGGDYFKDFRQRRAIIRGNTVTCDSIQRENENMFSKNKTKQNDQEKSEKEIIFERVEPQTFDV